MAKTHIHQYRRMTGRKTRANQDSKFRFYFKCALPGCNHYLRDFQILGKQSICNRCGKIFTLPLSIRMLTNIPHCKSCTKIKNPATLDEVNEPLDIEA